MENKGLHGVGKGIEERVITYVSCSKGGKQVEECITLSTMDHIARWVCHLANEQCLV